eukprot:TRINITY_DN7877_c0_g1_i1.p1 TRINITY_DN7877_c0_g1~~TRINITY_DN7877_c0_g1_i1.p1  ORF type:complete len:175 (+),score=65.55 TRINITY_DN7877_c0_g1_i1:42-527(+)
MVSVFVRVCGDSASGGRSTLRQVDAPDASGVSQALGGGYSVMRGCDILEGSAGVQEREVLLAVKRLAQPEAAPAPPAAAPTPAAPAPAVPRHNAPDIPSNHEGILYLLDMMSNHVSEAACRRALYMAQLDTEKAAEWLIEHLEDPDINDEVDPLVLTILYP